MPPTSPPRPLMLTPEMLERALYCTSPTGMRQLSQHLIDRGVQFTAQELHAGLALLAPRLIRKVIPFGGDAVELIALPGYGLG